MMTMRQRWRRFKDPAWKFWQVATALSAMFVLVANGQTGWKSAKVLFKQNQHGSFLKTTFTALKVADPVRPEGLFTGYYEPEAEGSRTEGNGYDVPIYRKPNDLVSFDQATEKQINLKYGRMVQGKPAGYFIRREIEEGALRGRDLEIVWLKSWVDAFFIHVQGSGRIRFADGSTMRLAYGAKTGQPYTGIGGLLVERGVLTRRQHVHAGLAHMDEG